MSETMTPQMAATAVRQPVRPVPASGGRSSRRRVRRPRRQRDRLVLLVGCLVVGLVAAGIAALIIG